MQLVELQTLGTPLTKHCAHWLSPLPMTVQRFVLKPGGGCQLSWLLAFLSKTSAQNRTAMSVIIDKMITTSKTDEPLCLMMLTAFVTPLHETELEQGRLKSLL